MVVTIQLPVDCGHRFPSPVDSLSPSVHLDTTVSDSLILHVHVQHTQISVYLPQYIMRPVLVSGALSWGQHPMVSRELTSSQSRWIATYKMVTSR